MSDTPVLSKSAKKKKKRKENKHNASGVKSSDGDSSLFSTSTHPVFVSPPDPKAMLKKQIEEAKAAKDLKKAQELREQLWLWQDTNTLGQAGPGAPKLDPTVFAPPPPPLPVRAEAEDPLERLLSKQRKKLGQIEELRAKRDRGETLDVNQLAKIDRSKEVEEEIALLEEQQRSLQLR